MSFFSFIARNGKDTVAVTPSNPVPIDVSMYSIKAKGATIALAATAAGCAIPNTSAGASPYRIRLCATTACYVRLAADAEFTAAPNAAGTGYVPGDVVVPAGGTGTPPSFTVTHTKVVSGAVAVAGTGGTPGSATVTGTTGAGTKFQATVTISGGGVITSVDSISNAGDYTTNPTAIALEPVTGGGLTGAKLAVVMGVKTLALATSGDFSINPANSAAQLSTTGAGINLTMDIDYNTDASAGDTMIAAGGDITLDCYGYNQLSAVRVTADGILQVSPLEN